MKRALLGILIYLGVAEALEYAILPQFKLALPEFYGALVDWPLLAMAGIMAGMLLGEVAGMLTALLAAGLSGFSQVPGKLGVSIVAFTLAAFLAGWLTRLFRWRTFVTRGLAVFLLLVFEQLVWGMTRKTFWPATALDIPWLSLCLTSLWGALGVTLLAGGIRSRKGMQTDED